jgi:hypothetical protein
MHNAPCRNRIQNSALDSSNSEAARLVATNQDLAPRVAAIGGKFLSVLHEGAERAESANSVYHGSHGWSRIPIRSNPIHFTADHSDGSDTDPKRLVLSAIIRDIRGKVFSVPSAPFPVKKSERISLALSANICAICG